MIDVDSFARRYRKPRMETQEEINQRMLSVELAVKEALTVKGETHFTDQEFPPSDQSLYLDPLNPPQKLLVGFLDSYSLLRGYVFPSPLSYFSHLSNLVSSI